MQPYMAPNFRRAVLTKLSLAAFLTLTGELQYV